MTRFTITKLQEGEPAPPNLCDRSQTIDLPDCPNGVTTWRDIIDWWQVETKAPHAFHMAIMALFQAFHPPKKPR